MADTHKNLAVSTVATAPSPATSGTTLAVGSGHGNRFPAPPFNATVWSAGNIPDPSNAEIIRVTAIGTLAIDATSPPVRTSSTNTTTTASFTPPANSLIVALAASGNPANNTVTASTCTVTDSIPSSWTLKKRQNNQGLGIGSAEIWMMDAGSSPSARTVTVTGSFNGVQLTVLVFTGAAALASQTATPASSNTTSNTVSLTTTTNGSYVVGQFTDSVSSYTVTANGASTILGQFADATNGATEASFRSTSTTTAPAATTFGLLGTAAHTMEISAMEILPSLADTLTITRAQESSTARTVIVGDQIAATITVKTLTDVETLATNFFLMGA